MLAAYKLRAVPINVNYRYVEDELVYLFDNADVVARVPERSSAPRSRRCVTVSRCFAAPIVVVGDAPCDTSDAAPSRYEDALAGQSRRARLRPA